MIVLICYDISDNKIRAKVHKILKECGLNTQKSVFECIFSKDELARCKVNIKKTINKREDSVYFYTFCEECYKKAKVLGCGIKKIDYTFQIL